MVKPLHRKLARDLVRLRGQALTIALVVMAGVASWVSLRATFESLAGARESYYERQSFGDVFASCSRAPASLVPRLQDIDGVTRVSETVVAPIRVRMPESTTPPTGVLIGVKPGGPAVDIPRVMSGRLPQPGNTEEGTVLEAFAKAHALEEGDFLDVIVGGSERRVRVVGTAVSPEYLFAIAPGDMTGDEKRFGVVWMDLDAVRKLENLPAAFNHVSLSLSPSANETQVITQVDGLLEPYGGVGAFGRSEQPSNRILSQELTQLRGMALITPTIFLAVAAFLLNAVLSRLITLERPEIAALRAIGYTGREVAVHYLQLVLVIAFVGAGAGIALGAWFGRVLVDLYAKYFHFPDPPFEVDARVVAMAVLVSGGSAIVGAIAAAVRIIRMPPAEAMRPPAPPSFRKGLLERVGLFAWLSPASRMIVREVTRKPLRMTTSVIALAFAVAINVVGRFQGDILDEFVTLMFSTSMREDMAVSFRRPVDESVVRSVAAIPGVTRAEPLRSTPVAIGHGHLEKRRTLQGHPEGASLRRFVDQRGEVLPLPRHGIALDDYTAELLGVRVGDPVRVRVLEGRRRVVEVPVETIFAGMTSLEAHTSLDALAEITQERGLTTVVLSTDPALETAVAHRLDDAPQVFSVTRRSEALARFEALTGETMTTMTILLTVFASIIAVGVVYNDARILLSSQARELASLRVLGFTRAEVSHILLGQIALEVALAILPGLVIGRALCDLIMSTTDPELYRFPTVISPTTYLASALVVVGAAVGSALLVRRRVDHLDLVQVLKTRD